MGLRDAILSAVSSAIDATGDIAESITFVTKTNSEYDVAFGQNVATETNYTIKAIISFDDNTISGKGSSTTTDKAFTGEITALFASKGLAFTPKTKDIVIRGNERYVITDIKKDPVGASYALKLRKVG